jgi:cytochrome c
MLRIGMAAVLAGLLAGGCAAPRPTADGPVRGPESSGVAPATATSEVLAAGEQIFQRLCSACHSMDSPPLSAPPITHVARHYRRAFDDREAGLQHMTAFIRAPTPEASVLPSHARERWGLMPALPLPEPELRAVAEYVWSLPDPSRGMHGSGPRGRP